MRLLHGLNYYFFGCPEAIDPTRVQTLAQGGRRQGWGSWSGRGSNLQPIAQRIKQMAFSHQLHSWVLPMELGGS